MGTGLLFRLTDPEACFLKPPELSLGAFYLRKQMKKGFTLIELVMVIVILGILAGFALPKYVDLSNSAKISTAKGSLGTIRAAIAIKYAENAGRGGAHSAYPDTIDVGLFSNSKIPVEPFHNSSAVEIGSGPPTTSVGGWLYDPTIGKVWINDSGLDPKGIEISSY